MYYWNDETVNYFVDLSKKLSSEKLMIELKSFIKKDCELEKNDTEDMLLIDLLNKLKSNY